MALRSWVLVATALLTACAHATPAPEHAAGPKSKKSPANKLPLIEPSRLLPDLDSDSQPQGIEPDGTKRFLTMQMRVIERPDGSILRARELLPAGRTNVQSIELPSRLGGGFLFVGATSSKTQLWRADSWLAKLEPIVLVNKRYDDIVPGFDRIYLTSRRTNTNTVAVDPASGEFKPLGNLPQPVGQGDMVFADAWRGVVVADFRGPLATFDAGTTWVPLGIDEAVTSLALDGDLVVIKTAQQTLSVDTEGRVSTYEPPKPVTDDTHEAVVDRPLGRRPLRAAIERGIPVAATRALVAYEGNLVEVSTEDGAVVRTVREAYAKSMSECQGIPLGEGVGFVCGARKGPTVVYAYQAPKSLTPVLEYPEPKVVLSSGNGAVVVRAPCPGGTPILEQSQYCVRDVRGAQREIRFQGDLGAERVVALADGRVAILIAPRPGAEARLVLLDGNKAVTRALSFEKLSQRERSLVRRGLWMQGAIEIKPGVLGIWVEAGGPILGLHVGVDGRVESGELQTTPGVILLSGRHGLVWRHGGEGLETTDGGLTWKEFDLPSSRPTRATTTRGCSAVGCAVEGWLRVGWGKPEGKSEMEEAPDSSSTNPPYKTVAPLQFECAPTGRATPPPAPIPAPKRVDPTPPRYHYPRYHPPTPTYDNRGWVPFGPSPAPTLGADQIGVGGGRDYGELRFRAYAWGPKSADWSRTGRWLIRFDDPFDGVGLPASSTPTTSPWQDLTIAAINVNSVRSAAADPGGRSAVLSWCPSHNQCQVFGVADGQTPIEFQFPGTQMLPVVTSAVRAAEGWYLLSGAGSLETTIHTVDNSGRVRLLATYPRVAQHRYDGVQLVRRASGQGIALWIRSATGEGESRWFILPVDKSTGELGSVQDIGPADLAGTVPPACAPGRDGWLLVTQLPTSPRFQLPDGSGFGGSAQVRIRADADQACIEAMACRARESEIRFGQHHAWIAGNQARPISMAVWDTSAQRKYELSCASTGGN